MPRIRTWLLICCLSYLPSDFAEDITSRPATRADLRRVHQAVLPTEPRDALWLEVVAVASAESGEVGHRRHAHRLRRGHLLAQRVEEVLEARGLDVLQEPAGGIAGVPKRVPLVPRL